MAKITRGTARVPTYLHHRPSGRAYCWSYVDGKRRQIYLGACGTPSINTRPALRFAGFTAKQPLENYG